MPYRADETETSATVYRLPLESRLRLDYEYPDMSLGKAWKRTKPSVRHGSDALRRIMRKAEKGGWMGWILSGGIFTVLGV